MIVKYFMNNAIIIQYLVHLKLINRKPINDLVIFKKYLFVKQIRYLTLMNTSKISHFCFFWSSIYMQWSEIEARYSQSFPNCLSFLLLSTGLINVYLGRRILILAEIIFFVCLLPVSTDRFKFCFFIYFY